MRFRRTFSGFSKAYKFLSIDEGIGINLFPPFLTAFSHPSLQVFIWLHRMHMIFGAVPFNFHFFLAKSLDDGVATPAFSFGGLVSAPGNGGGGSRIP